MGLHKDYADQDAKEKQKQALRQKQTKRVIHAFSLEIDSLHYINREIMNKQIDQAYDVSF